MRDVRYLILQAAKHLLLAQGYRGLSMRQVAEAVGVSKAAIYYHFRDKQALLLAILDSYLDEMESLLIPIQALDAPARRKIALLIEQILAQPTETRSVIRLSSQEMANLSASARGDFGAAYQRKFLNRIQAILEEGMQAGELRRMDAAVAAWALLGLMYPYFYPHHARQIPPAGDVTAQLTGLFLDGLAL